MGKLTTHVLDTMNGCPAAGMALSLYRMDGAAPQLLKQLELNDDGDLLNIIVDVQDITRFRAEEEMKSVFTSIISHSSSRP